MSAPCRADEATTNDRVLRVQDGTEAREYPLAELIVAVGLTELRLSNDPHFGPDRVFAGL
jgi:hypothetical protein